MARLRVHAAASGYEYPNGYDALRDDQVVHTACGRDRALTRPSTLHRFEQRAVRQWAIAIRQAPVEHFIASFTHPPEESVVE